MCLIKIVQNKIWMHDVLLKLGRKIVVQENVDPRERSRLWDADDVYRVLTTQGTGKVESISLDLSPTTEINLSPAAFEGMYNLRLLKFYYPPFLKMPSREQMMITGERVRIHLPQGLHFLSNELRILQWSHYPLKSLPSNFFPEKLVVLEMPCSQLEQLWNDYQNLKKEHSNLSDQVKTAKDSFLGPPNIVDTLQKLGNEYELLRKKYLQELSDRKRLYNEVIELKGNIRVFCRCRPLNQVEITNGSNYVVEFDSSQDNEVQIISSDSSKKQFKFDHVFEPEDNQEAVFAQTKPIVASVLDGYNACIFAYGQTGTGKTFTMEGSPENRGVNYRTLDELFRLSQERSGIMRYGLFVSMMEVYNEKIRDLLIESSNQPPKKLEIKQTAEGTQEVPGLVETRVTGTEDVWDLLKSGSRARSVGSTSANGLSSRSHCLLRVTVKGENLINGQKTRSHLWMVDLAGSERVGKIDFEGERLKESQFINKSLSALGDVISGLASKTGHIPYRNSKLTHMLQSSLGGDCKTLMFVQISPSATDLGETLCSLNFGSRVRGIESGPARKQADLSELFKYKQMVEKKLQDSLQSLQLRLAATEHICRTLQEKVRELENKLGEGRKTRLKQETRAFAAAASQSTIQVVEKRKIDKKPPLCPSKLRMPLRKITSSMPPPSPPLQKQKNCSVLSSMYEKENNPRITTAGTNTKRLVKPRRMSVAIRPPPPMPAQIFQPKRRVSMATYRSEPTSNMTTPLQTSRYKMGM
ncbi:hypothetical protein OIU77_018531 [Salix suchowensis]|uniref:Kinesin-like protein n=1 Tax=Salix suchowensis TaxID=1278906 RepID=A0ABQ9CD16_9ROSI|nr:hypothetical protein OIU77_018531 [Salix suchowensis]